MDYIRSSLNSLLIYSYDIITTSRPKDLPIAKKNLSSQLAAELAKLFYKRESGVWPRKTSIQFDLAPQSGEVCCFCGRGCKKNIAHAYARVSFWIPSFSTSKSTTDICCKRRGFCSLVLH